MATNTVNLNTYKAKILTNPREIYVDLSTTRDANSKVTFDGSADKSIHVSGTLPLARGGTGVSTWAKGGIVYASAKDVFGQIVDGTANKVLYCSASATYGWLSYTNSNTASTLVYRDANKNFSAGTITASLNGNASTATALYTGSPSNTSETSQDARIKTAIKDYFDSNYETIPRNKTISLYVSTGNGEQATGYFLSGYNSTPYGGFFVCHYDTPRYVGISNGTYSCFELLKNDSSKTYSISISGNATTATGATNDSDGNAINTTYLKLSGGTMTGNLTVPSILYVQAENNTNEGGQIRLAADPNHPNYNANLDVCDNYFRVHSNGAEILSMNLSGTTSNIRTNILTVGSTTATSETDVILYGPSGSFSLFSQYNTGAHGLWAYAHGTDVSGKSIILLDTNNAVTFTSGTFAGTMTGHSIAGTTTSDATGAVLLCPSPTSNTGIFNGNGDGNGMSTANLIIKSWYGVGFVDGCTGNGMTVGIDCRNGHIFMKGHLYYYYGNTWYTVFQNHNDGAVGVNACSGALYLAYQNTSSVNIFNGNAVFASSGGLTITGAGILVQKSANDTWITVKRTDTSVAARVGVGSSGVNHGVYSNGYSDGTTFTSDGIWIVYRANDGYVHSSTRIYGAVWNDYAEYRQGEVIEGGYCVTECSDSIMRKTTQRLQPGCRITSDTFGFAIGQTDKQKTPIAVSGRALVYTYRPREEYPLGAAVCSAPNGTVDIMTREEVMMYPERILGTVSEIPNYTEWHSKNINEETGTDEVIKVNNRIWIYVR